MGLNLLLLFFVLFFSGGEGTRVSENPNLKNKKNFLSFSGAGGGGGGGGY